MTLTDIEIFLYTVNTKNISKTATALYMAQSTVSHRLFALEAELGIVLFNRQKGKRLLELTPQGADFVPIAERWQKLWNDTLSLSSHHNGAIDLKIGSTASIHRSFFLPIYKNLIESQNPSIHLTIKTYTSSQLYESLQQHDLDFAFSAQLSYHNAVNSLPLFEESLAMIRCNPKAQIGAPLIGPAVDPLELDPSKEILTLFQIEYSSWRKKTWGKLNPTPLGSNDPHIVSEFLKLNDTWCITTSLMAHDYANSLALEIHPLKRNPPRRTVYSLLHHTTSVEKTPVMQQLFQQINAQMDTYEQQGYLSILNRL